MVSITKPNVNVFGLEGGVLNWQLGLLLIGCIHPSGCTYIKLKYYKNGSTHFLHTSPYYVSAANGSNTTNAAKVQSKFKSAEVMSLVSIHSP